ncbi:MAG: type II toxin-antitoxin system VapC family toxin [Xanthobacteraceae bacterium]
MIALDTSAIVAIALNEVEASAFSRVIVTNEALVGTPTLFESHLVLAQQTVRNAEGFFASFLARSSIHPVAFNVEMFRLAQSTFDKFGKGKKHRAKLNFGDCMSYAVAKFHDVPLLFKGDDFWHTDIRSALP